MEDIWGEKQSAIFISVCLCLVCVSVTSGFAPVVCNFLCVCVCLLLRPGVCVNRLGVQLDLLYEKEHRPTGHLLSKPATKKKGIRGGEHNTREQTRAPSNGQESISRNKNYKINRVPHTNKTHSSINYTLSLCAHKVQLNTGQQTSASISTRDTARTDSSHPRNIVKACVCVPAATD